MCIQDQLGRRRFRVDWDSVVRHRVLCRTYFSAYRKKLTDQKVTPEEQQVLDDCEERLDIFNIRLVRQQAEAEVCGHSV